MLLRLRALPGMAGWGLRFLRECRETALARQHAGHLRAGDGEPGGAATASPPSNTWRSTATRPG